MPRKGKQFREKQEFCITFSDQICSSVTTCHKNVSTITCLHIRPGLSSDVGHLNETTTHLIENISN